MTGGSLKPSSSVSGESEGRLLIPQELRAVKWIPFSNQVVRKRHQITFFLQEMH